MTGFSHKISSCHERSAGTSTSLTTNTAPRVAFLAGAKNSFASAALFLQHYAALKPEITPGEAMFILHLMEFKWDADHPYRGYGMLQLSI
jgi:hypothetical protein